MRFYHFRMLLEQEECRHFLSITKSLETTDDVRRFLMEENNSYEDLLVVIKNRNPNLRICSLRSVERFCSYHGIKKRMSVADGTVDITAQGAISEVRLCSKSPA